MPHDAGFGPERHTVASDLRDPRHTDDEWRLVAGGERDEIERRATARHERAGAIEGEHDRRHALDGHGVARVADQAGDGERFTLPRMPHRDQFERPSRRCGRAVRARAAGTAIGGRDRDD